MPESKDRRRTFVPVVGTAILAGVLAAVASGRPWVEAAAEGAPGHADLLPGTGSGEMPLAAALSLVALACWGVLLVTRRLVRRAVAGLSVVTALGLAATVVVGVVTLPGEVAETLREGGATGSGLDTTPTPWLYVAAVGAVVLVVAGVVAVWRCPAWPEMGSRYDAPGATGPGRDDVPLEDQSSLDLWKQLDEGRDPTA